MGRVSKVETTEKAWKHLYYCFYQQFLKSEKLFSLFGLLRSDFGPYRLAKIINDLHISKLKTKVSAIILIDFSDTIVL